MATSADYIEFVCDQIHSSWDIRYRKMFGEYMVYINEKPVLTVCNNTVYVKQLDCIKHLMNEALSGFPYNGAKPHYILDIEDRALSVSVVGLLEQKTPIPKPKKSKKTSE